MAADRTKLKIFDHLPEGHIAFPISDTSCAPLMHLGDVAIVDTSDRQLELGALYLRRGLSSGRIWIDEAIQWAGRARDEDGWPLWMFIHHNRPMRLEDWRSWSQCFGPVPMADGPYDRQRGASAVMGRVIGAILGPRASVKPLPSMDPRFPSARLLSPSQIRSRGNAVAGQAVNSQTHSLVPL